MKISKRNKPRPLTGEQREALRLEQHRQMGQRIDNVLSLMVMLIRQQTKRSNSE